MAIKLIKGKLVNTGAVNIPDEILTRAFKQITVPGYKGGSNVKPFNRRELREGYDIIIELEERCATLIQDVLAKKAEYDNMVKQLEIEKHHADKWIKEDIIEINGKWLHIVAMYYQRTALMRIHPPYWNNVFLERLKIMQDDLLKKDFEKKL